MTFFLWTWLLNTCTIVGAVSLGTYLLTIWAQELLGKTEQDLKAKYGAKWALVTGGSSGIGLALVNRLASQGISVVIVAYPDALLPKAIETLSLKYPSVEFRSIALDLSTPTAADVIAKDTEDLDINLVFNNAGYIKPGLFATSPLPTLLANYNTNATVTIAITHLFLNRMLAKGQKGLLCFTGSSGGFIPGPMSSIYSSTKAWMTVCFFLDSIYSNIYSVSYRTLWQVWLLRRHRRGLTAWSSTLRLLPPTFTIMPLECLPSPLSRNTLLCQTLLPRLS